jgi:hypothetical protein
MQSASGMLRSDAGRAASHTARYICVEAPRLEP